MSDNVRAAIGQAYNNTIETALTLNKNTFKEKTELFYYHRQLASILFKSDLDTVARMAKAEGLIAKYNKVYDYLQLPEMEEDSYSSAAAKGQAYNLAVKEALHLGKLDTKVIAGLFYKYRREAIIFQTLDVAGIKEVADMPAVLDLLDSINEDILNAN
jgi:hypothetical protein